MIRCIRTCVLHTAGVSLYRYLYADSHRTGSSHPRLEVVVVWTPAAVVVYCRDRDAIADKARISTEF
jgi:hypothetical protein